MHLLVPRSKSSAMVKVRHKGYISQKMAVSGAQTHLAVYCSISDDNAVQRILHEEDIRDLPEEELTTAEKIEFDAIRKTVSTLPFP